MRDREYQLDIETLLKQHDMVYEAALLASPQPANPDETRIASSVATPADDMCRCLTTDTITA